MLGWLCIVQSLLAYTPGIRAGAILLGLPPLVPVGGYAPATPFSINKRFIDRLKTVAVSLLPQLLYLLYLRLKYIEDLTESLEMHNFTRPEELDRVCDFRYIPDNAQNVVIRASGFLFWGDLVSTTYTKI